MLYQIKKMSIVTISFITFLLIMYAVGLDVQIKNYKVSGKFLVADLILFILSPISMLPVYVINVVSYVVDMDKVLIQKKD